jgi:hypothetical protein
LSKTWIRKGPVILLICLVLVFNIPVLSSVSADSFDGVSWEKYSDASGPIIVVDIGNPGDLDHPWALSNGAIRDNDVLTDSDPTNDDELYKMWYSGNKDMQYYHFRIFYATSPDGFVWHKYVDGTGAAIPVIDLGGALDNSDDASAYSPCVLNDGGVYKMWYSGQQRTTGSYKTLYATSTDGITWTKHGIVLDVGTPGTRDEMDAYAPSVIIDNDALPSKRYKMWYMGQTMSGPFKIFYATSSDGVTWIKYADSGGAIPVLEPGGAPGGFDDSSTGHQTVLKDEDGLYRMWHNGFSSQGGKILYASSTDGINWNKHGLALDKGAPGELDDISVGGPSVLIDPDGTYRLWHQGHDGNYVRIFHAYSVSLNLPPIAIAGPDQTIDEGQEVHFDGSASSDPDGSIVSYEWDFDVSDDLWWDTTAPPDATGPITTHVYGDNGVFTTTLRVTDDQGASAQDICNITVMNINPSVSIESAMMDVEVGLRVAGRKYNDVGMTLYEEGNPLGYLSIERLPGSPDDQLAWMPMTLDMTKKYSANITYIPEDPPGIGSNPIWVYIRFENGSIQKLHHNFNVQQSMKRDSEHWNHVEPWEVDLNVALMGWNFELACHITDPGSDDEIVTCDYVSQNIITTFLNNPPTPDPYPSLEVNPVDITAAIPVSYEGPGILTLQVEDDDSGKCTASITLE